MRRRGLVLSVALLFLLLLPKAFGSDWKNFIDVIDSKGYSTKGQ
jgi:hypothetical protein